MSARFTLGPIDWTKIGKGLLIALAGAALTYVSEVLLEVDFGQLTAVVAAIWAVVVNIVRKWIANNPATG